MGRLMPPNSRVERAAQFVEWAALFIASCCASGAGMDGRSGTSSETRDSAASEAHRPRVLVTVMAQNEEDRIAACLDALPKPADDPGLAVTVVVNGSSDRTADIVRTYADQGIELAEYREPGKSRSWNRIALDEGPRAQTHIYVDGDAELFPGSVAAFERALAANPGANAASGLPLNGRRAFLYRRSMRRDHGLFGDCFALRGTFLDRMGEQRIRLPEDLIGDDGLIGALAKTDLGHERDWDDKRVVVCEDAGFYCAPIEVKAQSLAIQKRRMESYAMRHFQNRIVQSIMRGEGASGLPNRLSDLYPQWLPRFSPRLSPLWFAFDRRALEKMRALAGRTANSRAGERGTAAQE